MSIHSFDLLMELDARFIRLDCAALHLARDRWPELCVPAYLEKLDRIAFDVASLRPGLSASLRYEAMRQVVVEQYQLSGNEDDYFDPENSYLNRVLDRRKGVPITLSIVWMEVARRLKWPVSGLGLQDYFIVRFDDDERFVLADPFRQGRALTLEDCRKVLRNQYDGAVEFSPVFLKPVPAAAILQRLLYNLRYLYAVNHDWGRLAAVLERLSALEPGARDHAQDLACLLYSQGDLLRSHAQLSRYLKEQPLAAGDFLTHEKLTHLDAIIASLN